MRGTMMALLCFGAVMLLPGAASAQEPWPERHEERRERCLQLRDDIEHDKQEERHHKAEGDRHAAREDRERIKHERHVYREHRCREILRH
jgi:hypothetical protein